MVNVGKYTIHGSYGLYIHHHETTVFPQFAGISATLQELEANI